MPGREERQAVRRSQDDPVMVVLVHNKAATVLNQSLFLVFLKTKVPNGNCLSPRLSKNLSQALRIDKIWPLRSPSNFSSPRLEFES